MDGPNNRFQSPKELILTTNWTSINALTLAEYVLTGIQMGVQGTHDTKYVPSIIVCHLDIQPLSWLCFCLCDRTY